MVMKVLGINGSARKDGNTASMLKYLFEELRKEDVETEMYQMAGKKAPGCIACYKCFDNANRRCSVDGDAINEVIEKMLEADGIVLASPTYFADVSPEIKAVMDRAGMVSIANGGMLARKVGAGVAVARRGGSIHAFDTLNHFFFINQMIVPGSSYWNLGFGLNKGDIDQDEEAILTMQVLGQNMAWLLKKIND
jgi:multimeric flavodoxin WrbA